MYNMGWLDLAEAAAVQLAGCCRAARGAAGAATGSDLPRSDLASASKCTPAPAGLAGNPAPRPPGQDTIRRSEAELREAVRRLQDLLDEFLPYRPQQGGTSGSRGAPTSDSGAASLLLQLPQELLPHIARLAGKEARLACHHLRAAYNTPAGGSLCEPLQGGCSIDSVELAAGGPRYTPHSEATWQGELLCNVVKACYRPPCICLDTIRHCVLQWPGHFTSLALSGAAAPDLATMQEIHAALPGLRSLKCGWVDFPEAVPVPEFTALSALTVTADVEDALQPRSAAVLPRLARTLQMAPAVQSLRLDLRFLPVPAELMPGEEYPLRTALESLQHLTHLDVTFDETVHAEEEALNHAVAVLESAAERLRGLTLRSPAYWLPDLGDILGWCMPMLTRLQLIGLDGFDPGQSVDDMPALRTVVLGCDAPDNRWATATATAGARPFTLFITLHARNLASLTLPVQVHHMRDICHPDGPQSLLINIRERCPQLTSLQLGSYTAAARTKNTFAAAPRRDYHWLATVGGITSLRRLALLVDEADVAHLACLAPLAALSCLWLQLKDGWRLEAPPGGPSGSQSGVLGLAELTQLQSLTISLDPDRKCADELVGLLMEAVAALPQLQVLDTYGMVQTLASEEVWRAFARAPPPELQRLVLRVNCGDAGALEAARQLLRLVDGVLHQHLPARVRVVTHVGGAFGEKLGPRPWEGSV